MCQAGEGIKTTIPIKGKPHDFTAEELDDLIATIGEERARLAPKPPREYEPDGEIKAINDPNWSCEMDGVTGVTMLSLRDVRFGWLTYAMPPRSADALIRQMARLQLMGRPSHYI